METKSTCPYCGVGCGPHKSRGLRAAGMDFMEYLVFSLSAVLPSPTLD